MATPLFRIPFAKLKFERRAIEAQATFVAAQAVLIQTVERVMETETDADPEAVAKLRAALTRMKAEGRPGAPRRLKALPKTKSHEPGEE